MSKVLNKNYKAVTEGKLSKSEFLRQTRQQYPSLISQFTSYSDAINILKNKGILEEEKAEYCPECNRISVNQLDRGIRKELEDMGLEDPQSPSAEEYKEAKNIAIRKLRKDPLCYLELAQEPQPADKAKPVQSLSEGRAARKANRGEIALKEALSKIIPVVLSEAATANLAKLSDENATIQGLPAILNSLENVVTEIESFILKERTKVQGIFDSIGSIKNEDNIPIGYKFVQPILNSFKEDLQPVLAKISLDDIKLPEAPQDFESAEELEAEPEDKETVFSPKGAAPNPLAESKRRKIGRFLV